MKVKFTPTTAQRLEVIKFIAYELWMLSECARMPKSRTPVENNLWYEGLVLHARVLRDFFFTKVKKGKRKTFEKDIVAVDSFTHGAVSWSYTSNDLPAYLKDNKERMDGALAHLSFERLKYTGNDKAWSAADLRAEIGAKWLEFIEKLQSLSEPAAKPFLEEAKRRKVPLTAPF